MPKLFHRNVSSWLAVALAGASALASAAAGCGGGGGPQDTSGTGGSGGSGGIGGSGGGSSCPTGQQACAGSCVDTTKDPAHCGACGTTCSADQVCADGQCASSCAPTTTACSGACVDTKTDPQHCGACDVACTPTQTCAGGACACPAGQSACGETCADLATNSEHCGACDHACGADEVCDGSACAPLVPGNGVLGGSLTGANPPKVAILASSTGGATDLQSRLQALNAFAPIDTVNTGTSTPTLAALKQYDAVAVFSYLALQDAVQLGDNLADYLDAGGGVLVFSYATWEDNVGNQLKGRYATDYALMTPQSPVPHDVVSLGQKPEANSPILAGVSTFGCKASSFCYHLTSAVKNGGVVVANWSDGNPLAIRGDFNGHTVVELNFLGASAASSGAWDPTTDGAVLIKNALAYTIPKAALTAASQLDLGSGPVFMASQPKTITYTNTGFAPRTITALAVSGAHAGDFVVTPSAQLPATIAVGGTFTATVTFTPSGTGLRAATVSATAQGFATPLTTLLTGSGT